jgi:16S rRNA (cytosine967-C5)-methyltransferase
VPARELALQILVASESRSAYSDRMLESRLRESPLSSQDAALVTTLVQGTLRARALLDHHLAGLMRGGLDELPPWIRAALRMGAYQILRLTRVPARAAVDESVKLAKRYGHPGTAGLVNAVLRRLAAGDRTPLPDEHADPAGHLAVLHSHPRWLVERWIGRYGREDAERLLAADNVEPEVTVRANRSRIDTARLAAALHEEGFESRPGPHGGDVLVLAGGYVASRSRLFRDGLLSFQDEAESAVCAMLDPHPGMRALDLCAAPGGKSSQIAERLAPGGRLVAMERHGSRARALRANLIGRLGLAGVDVVCGDGASPPLRGSFDRVLVDAPCSGLGVLRRRADARWRKEERSIRESASLQRRLLAAAAALVGPGGVLVYSVCSLEPEETDAIVEPFLSANAAFEKDDAGPFLPPGFRSGGPEFRALPHVHGTDGVYAVRLRRP